MATTPNMLMNLPTVAVTTGTGYATQQNAALDVVDAHDHTSGKGVRVPASGIDVNADLPFGSNAATGLGSAQFTSQTVALTGIESALYFLDGDLYAIDGDGNAIQMTVGGVIASGIVGNISGLTSPATAAYAASTFTWKSTANRYAVMAGGPVSLRRADEDNPNAITMQPAASTATQTLTLPAALPGASAFVTVDSSGNFGYTPALSQGITKAMQAAVGQQVSASSGLATTSSATFANLTNLTITITTTGRPILIMTQQDGSTAGAGFSVTTGPAALQFSVTGSATTSFGETAVIATQTASPSAMQYLYAAAAGTYTIKVQGKTTAGSLTAYGIVITAFEL